MGRDTKVITEINYEDDYPDTIEMLIDFNDSFTLYDIIRKKSKGEYLTNKGALNVRSIIDDLRRCLVVSMSDPITYVMKCYDGVKDIQVVKYKKRDEASKILNDVMVGRIEINRKMVDISLWDIYFNNTKMFIVRGIKFYSPDPTIFSYFKGYPYEKVDEVNMSLIQPFLYHTREVIANGDEVAYDYLLKWTASIFQKPSLKTGVVILIIGDQGTGKTTYSDVICKMMGRYANNNITSLNSIAGQFNSIVENNKLIVLNELQSIDNNGNKFDRNAIGGSLKSIITDYFININGKFKDERLAENVANFIMISNNMLPVNIEINDRRYLVLKTSNAHMQDAKYFDALYRTINEEGFYENLFTYFMNMDISGINIHEAPKTETKKAMQKQSMDSREAFVRDKYKSIVDIKGPELYEKYKKYCAKNGYNTTFANRSFLECVKKYTGDPVQKKINGINAKVYNLMDKYKEEFAKENNEPLKTDERVTMNRNVLINILRQINQGSIDSEVLLYDLMLCSGLTWNDVKNKDED